MDIRNITTSVKDVEGKGNFTLYVLYKYASLQFNLFQKNGPEKGLPNYPIDIHKAIYQELLKDFIARVSEELFEGLESLNDLYKFVSLVDYLPNISLFNAIKDEKVKEDKVLVAKDHWDNVIEEAVDALGFFMTLMLYLEITPQKLINQYGYELYLQKNMDLCYHHTRINRYLDITSIKASWINTVPSIYELPTIKRIQHLHYITPFLINNILYPLNLARNSLKNRPWKNTQVMTKEIEVQNYLVTAFGNLLGYFSFLGFSGDTLIDTYYKKYKLNEWRITTNY